MILLYYIQWNPSIKAALCARSEWPLQMGGFYREVNLVRNVVYKTIVVDAGEGWFLEDGLFRKVPLNSLVDNDIIIVDTLTLVITI